MRHYSLRPSASWILGGLVWLTLAAIATAGNAGAKDIPPFDAVQQTVLRHFQAKPDFRPTDLIVREDAAPLLGQLQKMGLPLPNCPQILERIPTRGEFLVEELSTPKGRSFMREIAQLPNGYDRVDRLSRLPRGQQTVRDLVKGPGGAEMIKYMTTAKGGKELGRMLSSDPHGSNFNAPTSRIYTAAMLLDCLKESHAAAVKAAGKTAAAPR